MVFLGLTRTAGSYILALKSGSEREPELGDARVNLVLISDSFVRQVHVVGLKELNAFGYIQCCELVANVCRGPCAITRDEPAHRLSQG